MRMSRRIFIVMRMSRRIFIVIRKSRRIFIVIRKGRWNAITSMVGIAAGTKVSSLGLHFAVERRLTIIAKNIQSYILQGKRHDF